MTAALVGALHIARAEAPRDFSKPLEGDQKILHALNRLSFGARPGDLERVKQIGLNKWMEGQLDPQHIDDGVVERKLSTLETLKMTPQQLMLAQINDTAGFLKMLEGKKPQKNANAPNPNANGANPQDVKGQPKQLNRQQQQTIQMLQDADLEKQTSIQAVGELQTDKIVRALDSQRQLYEILVDFWSNHFNIDVKKKAARTLKIVDERDVIRPRVLGKFRDLLGASAKSPAMLVYLDNATSTREFDMQPRLAGRINQRRAARLQGNAANQNVAAENEEAVAAQPAPAATSKKRGGLNAAGRNGSRALFYRLEFRPRQWRVHVPRACPRRGRKDSARPENLRRWRAARRRASTRYPRFASFDREIHRAQIVRALRRRRAAAKHH
jgi:hypothetical protein